MRGNRDRTQKGASVESNDWEEDYNKERQDRQTTRGDGRKNTWNTPLGSTNILPPKPKIKAPRKPGPDMPYEWGNIESNWNTGKWGEAGPSNMGWGKIPNKEGKAGIYPSAAIQIPGNSSRNQKNMRGIKRESDWWRCGGEKKDKSPTTKIPAGGIEKVKVGATYAGYAPIPIAEVEIRKEPLKIFHQMADSDSANAGGAYDVYNIAAKYLSSRVRSISRMRMNYCNPVKVAGMFKNLTQIPHKITYKLYLTYHFLPMPPRLS